MTTPAANTNANYLLVSAKERTATDPTQLPTAFRQIERWANQLVFGSALVPAQSVWPRARFYSTTAQSITASGAFITWGATDYTQGGIGFSGNTITFTNAPLGLYHITYQVKFAPPALGVNGELFHNGQGVSFAGQSQGSSAYWALAGGDDVMITATTDTLQIEATPSGATAALQNDNKYPFTNGGADNYIALFLIP